MNERQKLLLPINVFIREFDGKLLLALLARERGFDVILGAKSALHRKLPELTPALYVAKSAHGSSADFFAWLHRRGSQVVLLDEESLVRQSDDIYMMKHRKDALKHVALLLAWGQDDRKLWQSSGLLYQAAAVAIGNPRVDMLRSTMRYYHADVVSSIAERFKDYILLNTNFPRVNHAITLGENVTIAEKTPEAAGAWRKFLEYKREIFERFKDVVPDLARSIYPRNLVVRPHPSELQDPWLEASKGLANVHVVREGGIVPWLIGARALIHNGCTSAVEYALLDKLPLSYRSGTTAPYEESLPNKLSASFHTKEELLQGLAWHLEMENTGLPPGQRQILEENIEMLPDQLCGEKIMDAVQGNRTILNCGKERSPLIDFRGIWDGLIEPVQKFRKSMRPDSSRRREDALNKFPNIGADYFDARIRRFQECLGRFHGMQAKQIARRLFMIV